MEEITVDIEKIMQEIRDTIAKKKQLDIPPFEAVSQEENAAAVCESTAQPIDAASPAITQLRNDVRYLQGNFCIPYYWDLGSGFKAFLKKIVRRLIKCIVINLVSYQNTYNSFVAETSDAVRVVVEEQQKEIQQLKNEIASLRQQNEQLQKQLTKIIVEKN